MATLPDDPSRLQSRPLPHRTRNDLPPETRQRVAVLLNQRLAEAITLSSYAKQAHWNVRGPHFFSLHQLFDQIYKDVVAYMDLLAERVGQLGGAAEGTVAVAAQRAGLPEYPLELVDGAAHLDALAASLSAFGALIRQSIDLATDLRDAGTADLFTEISRGLDQDLWFVESHLQGGPADR